LHSMGSCKVTSRCFSYNSGYSPQNGLHSNPRECLEPSDTLKAKIFPNIEQAEELVNEYTLAKKETELAGRSWLSLLKWFRSIILQDAAVLLNIESYSNHPMFDHPLFKGEEFLTFQEELNAKMENERAPEMAMMERTLPVLGEAILTLTTEIKKIPSQIERLGIEVESLKTSMKTELHEQLAQQPKLQDFQSIIATTLEAAASHNRPIGETVVVQPNNSCMTSLTAPEISLAPPITPKEVAGNMGMPTFKFNKNIATVAQTWLEYDIGLVNAAGESIPSVRSQPPKWYGNLASSEGKHFSRRQHIYSAVEKTSNLADRKALIEILDVYMASKKYGLTGLNKDLKANQSKSFAGLINLYSI
jgi:hypothetical protein